MLVKVLTPFPYAADGIHNRDLVVDALEQIHDDLVPGLAAEGYVTLDLGGVASEPPVVASAPPVVAPAEVAPPAEGDDQFTPMDDKALRAFIKARDGVTPHNTVKTAALLEIARNKPAA